MEPNETKAQADASPLVLAGNFDINGTLPVGDGDVFRINAPAGSVYRLEVFTGADDDCTGNPSMTLALLDASGTQLTSDTSRGIGTCPALAMPLPTNTAYVYLSRSSASTLGYTYRLQGRLLKNAGTETEPNNTTLVANLFTGTDDVISATLSGTSDFDVFQVTLPAGKAMRLEMTDGATSRCDVDFMLATLEVLNGSMAVAASSSNSYCPLLDGTGTFPQSNTFASLAPGTYFVRVRTTQATPFTYRLAVTVR